MKDKWLIVLFFLPLFAVQAQRHVVQNLQGFDKKKYHFGFFIGGNTMGGKLHLNNQLYQNDTIYSVNLKGRTGFTFGVITDLHLGELWDLRCLFPALTFGQRDFEYRVKTVDNEIFKTVRSVESTYISLPIELKYKSLRYGNVRLFVLGGGELGYDLVSQKNVDQFDKSIVRLNRWNYGYSFGFGAEFFLEYFKFAPQIKWTNGINNLLNNDQTPFTNIIDKMNSKLVVVSLTFEG